MGETIAQIYAFIFINMSIINCKQFKKKHNRTIDNPYPDEESHPIAKMQLVSKHNFTFRRQELLTYKNVMPNAMKKSQKQCLEEKEASRKTVLAKESSISKSITNEQTQGSMNKQQKKKKVFRYLKTEIQPALNKNIYTSQMNTSLVKSKKSSTQSLRIHKIKSIVSLQDNNERLPAKGIKQAKAYRYQDSVQRQEQTKSKDSLMKTIAYRRRAIVDKRETDAIPIERQVLKRQFTIFWARMQEIQKGGVEDELKDYCLQAISQLIGKNIRSSVNIMTRLIRRKLKQKIEQGWQHLQSNSHTV